MLPETNLSAAEVALIVDGYNIIFARELKEEIELAKKEMRKHF